MSHSEQSTMINCAMNFGAVVGLYYIVKFCLFPLSMHSTIAALLFLGMTIVVPLLVGLLTMRYRDLHCGGQIRFTQAFAFSALIMCFGALLVAAVHYIYFAYIDNGAVVAAVAQSTEMLQDIDIESVEGVGTDTITQYNQYIELMQQTMQQLQAMSPIDITMGMLSSNVSWSFIISLPIALFTRHKTPQP